jgi:DNA uptake protein ComE-like DNA-binding protein
VTLFLSTTRGATVSQEKRDLPLVINLNTVTIPELMTVPGVTLPIARQIAAARSRLVFFTAIFDLATEGVPPHVVLTIASFPPLASPLIGGLETNSP